MNGDINLLTQKRRKWVEANRENNFEEGIKRLLTELYPDNAHFIYELLQNAEDTGASAVRFTLDSKGLEFEHNGNRLFSMADVDSITSIGVSTKRNDPTSIGKFGVGFKAVFAYTNIPEIHSGKFHFRIHDLVVPETDGINQPRMGERETRFIFPFDHPRKQLKQAVKEVENSLCVLGDNTLLFLSHIRKIEYLLPNGSFGSLERIDHEGGRIEIRASHPGGDETVSHWLRFQKDVEVIDEEGDAETRRIAIAFSLVEEEDKKKRRTAWKVVPLDHGQVSIYFPADKETSNLRFHLHAPFASTVARDSVRDCKANHELRDNLADLIVESFTAIRDQGMLTVGFLAVLPNPADNLTSLYEPIRKAIVTAFQNEPLTPTRSGTHAKVGVLYRGPARIAEVLNDDDLSWLTQTLANEEPPLWSANPPPQSQREDRFLDSLDIDEWGWGELANSISNLDGEERECIEGWISQKDDAWLMRFYSLLGEACAAQDESMDESDLRIVRVETDHGDEHVTPKEAFFQPDEGTAPPPDINFVKPTVYITGKSEAQKKYATSFLKTIGVRPFDAKATIEIKLAYYDKHHSQVPDDQHKRDLKLFIDYWKNNPSQVSLFKDHALLRGISQDSTLRCRKAHELYLDMPFMDTGLHNLFNDATLEWMEHSKDYLWPGYYDIAEFTKFAVAIGVMCHLEIRKFEATKMQNKIFTKTGKETPTTINDDYYINGQHWSYKSSPYYIGLFKLESNSLALSLAIWKTLCIEEPQKFSAHYVPNETKRYKEKKDTAFFIKQLKASAWVPDLNGTFSIPADLTEKTLHPDFLYDNRNGWLTAIGFGENHKKKTEAYKAQKEILKGIGIVQIEEFYELTHELGSLPEDEQRELFDEIKQLRAAKSKPDFPVRESDNPARRVEKVLEAFGNSPDKTFEKMPRSVRTSGNGIKEDAKVKLLDYYTNDDGQMVCQICADEMPFKLDDDTPYFEAVECSEDITKECVQKYLALCPVCAAKFRHVNRSKKYVSTAILDSDDLTIPVTLAREEHTVKFVRKHLEELQAIIRVIKE